MSLPDDSTALQGSESRAAGAKVPQGERLQSATGTLSSVRLRNAKTAGICSPLAKQADCVYFAPFRLAEAVTGAREELRTGSKGARTGGNKHKFPHGLHRGDVLTDWFNESVESHKRDPWTCWDGGLSRSHVFPNLTNLGPHGSKESASCAWRGPRQRGEGEQHMSILLAEAWNAGWGFCQKRVVSRRCCGARTVAPYRLPSPSFPKGKVISLPMVSCGSHFGAM
ncbi:E3 Ubiquitin-Protein Ligase Mycbp2 [Manis pentadactyla]|nr:E3 Ubiquitin-Protein Ligase Mycbp2 [Manis pentadactyla]